MTLVMLALLVALTAATALILADSALRLWSAAGGLKQQNDVLRGRPLELPRMRPAARVTTQVNYARPNSAPLRAAA